MIEEGRTMLGYSTVKGRPYFWRIVIANPYVTEEQLVEVLGLIEKYGNMSFKQIIAEFKKE